jgi:hypothetical protein
MRSQDNGIEIMYPSLHASTLSSELQKQFVWSDQNFDGCLNTSKKMA